MTEKAEKKPRMHAITVSTMGHGKWVAYIKEETDTNAYVSQRKLELEHRLRRIKVKKMY